MAKLTGQTIASSYDQLLIVTGSNGITSSLQAVESGDTGGAVSSLQISTVGAAIDNPTASSSTQGGKLTLFSDDGAVMASGDRLGVIEFSGAEDTSSTITVGARIEAITDATWSGSENGADLVFYTTDGDASQSEVMRLTADNYVGIGGSPESGRQLHINATSADAVLKVEAGSGAYEARIELWPDSGEDNADQWSISAREDDSLYFRNYTDDRVTISSAGDVGMGVSPTYRLDILDDVSPQLNITSSSSNDTAKYAHITCGHYHNAEEPITLVEGRSDGSNNYARIGGGRSEGNSVNFIEFYLGANDATVGGTRRFNLDTNSRISLSNNESGDDNTVFGFLAGAALASGGDDNTLIGDYAGNALTTADGCIAIGSGAMLVHTTGGQNIAIGANAMKDTNVSSQQLGSLYNVFIGSESGGGTWTGTTASSYNTAVGSLTMDAAMAGASSNTALGYNAGSGILAGSKNTLLGAHAGASITSGNYNICIGEGAGNDFDAESENVIIGYQAATTDGYASAQSVIIGAYAVQSGTHTADGTIAIGYQSGKSLTSGAQNVLLGYQAAANLTTGAANVAIGYGALDAADGGEGFNVAIGNTAMSAVDEGSNNSDDNVAIGSDALLGGTGQVQHNVVIGASAMNSTGSNAQTGTVAIGSSALTD